MRRRTVLATAPALLAGCFEAGGGAPPSTARTTTVPTTTSTPTATGQPIDRIPVDPASMTADEVRQRLAARDCRTLTDLPSCCPGDDGKLGVSASPTVASLPDDTVEFTVENLTDERFMTNHYDWLLRKWDGSRWRHVAPLAIPLPLASVPPGGSHTHRIEPVESEVIRSSRAYVTEVDVTLGGLGPGVYGFSTRGYFESAPDDERAATAVFGFRGDAPAVRPTDDVVSVERDGSELVVRADPPDEERGELVVSFVDAEPDARLLPEHMNQLAALRNTLPYAATGGIRTIRYVGNSDDVQMVDSYLPAVTPDGTKRYGFRGYAVELSTAT